MLEFMILSIVMCAVFTVAIYFASKDPINVVMSYPKNIRDKVDSLPQYKSHIKTTKKKHILKKIISVIIFIVVIVLILILLGKTDFLESFVYTFALFSVVNLYDLVIIDWIWVPCSKRWIIKGTEEFTKQLNSKFYHFIGFLKGTIIGAGVSFVVALIVSLIV